MIEQYVFDLWLKNDFDAAIFLVTKFFVCFWGIGELHLMSDDKRRINASIHNHCEKFLSIVLNMGLACFKGQPFVHESAKRIFSGNPTYAPGTDIVPPFLQHMIVCLST